MEAIERRAGGMEGQEAIDFLLGVVGSLQAALLGEDASNEYELTPQEMRLWLALKRSPNQIKSRESLLYAMYFDRHVDDWNDTHTVEVVIFKVRRKLPAEVGRIENVWGQGYRYVEPGQ